LLPYEAEVTGAPDALQAESACNMPVSVQVDHLRHALRSRAGEAFVVENADLYALEGAERDLALDAMVAGEPSPYVLVGGRLVCTGSVDVPVVLEALAL
jgi:hypothetical protein